MAFAKVTLKAVHDTDLIRVLKKLGIYDDVVSGKFRCFICGKPITLENLGGMFKSRDGKIHLVCNDVKCLLAAAEVTSKIANR